MKYPLICIDNFYKDPLSVREFALKQIFTTTKKGGFPGKRTEPLHLLDKSFFDNFCYKVFSIFYDLNKEDINWTVNTNFDINTKDDVEGWIHKDENAVFVGVIYLTPNIDNESGTNFYKKTKDFDEQTYVNDKINYFTKKEKKEKYFESLQKHNKNFERTIKIDNVFNRFVAYDANTWHSIGNLKNVDERLTQVFFVEKCDVRTTPIERINSYVI